VSWELAIFGLLAAVILAGFAWYERSRPPSQVVALVAALAALAVAGRIALAPIPNVVATTDVALIAGYTIGAAPGFVVGALAALVSNFWLGQGPWTPWQMAAWGLCGAGGAALAVLTGRRLGRVGLALACGFGGVLYGTLLNFSLMVSYGGDLTWERFLTLEVRAIPFDAAHAIGNITLALVAGPAMVRMLIRFRQRFEWRRAEAPAGRRARVPGLATGGLPLLVAATALIAASLLLAPGRAAAAGADSGAAWLAGAQNGDGGFGTAPGEESSAAMTGWAMLGLEAGGRNPYDVARNGNSAVDYLRRNADSISDAGDLSRTILALVGAGAEPRDFADRNLVAELRDRIARNGSIGGQVNLTAFGVMALRGAGSPAGLKHTLDWLREAQNGDGGWGFTRGVDSDADSTGAALQAVRGSKAADLGVRYLRRHQRGSGGWALAGGSTVNSQSTAWAVQGLVAAGVSPERVLERGRSGLDYLAARQDGNGHYRYSASSDQTPVWVTGQAVVAAAAESFPLAEVERKPKKKQKSKQATGSGQTFGDIAAPSGGLGAGTDDGGGGGGGSAADATIGGPAAAGAEAGAPEDEDPGAAGEDESSAEAADFDARSAEDESERDPVAPIGVGVGAGLLALAGTVLIGRRREW
jgi:energy-coupling factor transport system substrate-specific component